MDSYIRLYEDRVPVNKCQEMINLFEQDTANHQIQDCGGGATLTQVNMLHSKDTPWREYANFLVNVIMNCVEDYRKDCHIQSHHFPTALDLNPRKLNGIYPIQRMSFLIMWMCWITNLLEGFSLHLSIWMIMTMEKRL